MMKLLAPAIFVLVSVGTSPAFSQDDSSEMDSLIADGSACEIVMMFAGQIMRNRQLGVNVADVMGIGDEIGGDFDALLNELTLKAYELPRFSTPQYQERAIEDFSNDAYVQCIRAAQ